MGDEGRCGHLGLSRHCGWCTSLRGVKACALPAWAVVKRTASDCAYLPLCMGREAGRVMVCLPSLCVPEDCPWTRMHSTEGFRICCHIDPPPTRATEEPRNRAAENGDHTEGVWLVCAAACVLCLHRHARPHTRSHGCMLRLLTRKLAPVGKLACRHACVRVRARMQARTHKHARMYTRTLACIDTRTDTRTHARTHARTHTDAQTYARMHARTHTRIGTRTHARTHVRLTAWVRRACQPRRTAGPPPRYPQVMVTGGAGRTGALVVQKLLARKPQFEPLATVRNESVSGPAECTCLRSRCRLMHRCVGSRARLRVSSVLGATCRWGTTCRVGPSSCFWGGLPAGWSNLPT